ncbi:site-specific recombinase [Microcoleus sp. bin38.metabat.b11b12b14.051]|uniref:site-specific recombinase n=1 Tax=Microcoleus sp. bin38.metabat.b11b12b14.051 TaxID=2742709 RepID=UPI0025D9A776|nr:site-specific recombinase [Microcoleus sp. bin38.metabat.b11b12b14.051]
MENQASQARLNQANGRLRAAKIGVRIEERGDRLSLRATLPSKTGGASCQQRIALGIHSNIAGISLAEKEARKLALLIDSKEFTWDLYATEENFQAIANWIQKFEESKRQTVSVTTWKTDYARPFGVLPADQPIALDTLLSAIAKTKPNTRQRRRFCLAFRQLAQFAGLEIDVDDLIGNYSPARVLPRDLPTDDVIADCFDKIENPQWQWIYGVIAAYGLRDHEAFYLDMSKFPIAQVLEGKTGYRQCWPLWPEWAEKWQLADIKQPNVTGVEHADFGARVCKFFARSPATFHAYDLRHAWAIRAVRLGLDASLAAKQMGHSLAVHSKTYHLALNEREQQRAYDHLLTRGSEKV